MSSLKCLHELDKTMVWKFIMAVACTERVPIRKILPNKVFVRLLQGGAELVFWDPVRTAPRRRVAEWAPDSSNSEGSGDDNDADGDGGRGPRRALPPPERPSPPRPAPLPPPDTPPPENRDEPLPKVGPDPPDDPPHPDSDHGTDNSKPSSCDGSSGGSSASSEGSSSLVSDIIVGPEAECTDYEALSNGDEEGEEEEQSEPDEEEELEDNHGYGESHHANPLVIVLCTFLHMSAVFFLGKRIRLASVSWLALWSYINIR